MDPDDIRQAIDQASKGGPTEAQIRAAIDQAEKTLTTTDPQAEQAVTAAQVFVLAVLAGTIAGDDESELLNVTQTVGRWVRKLATAPLAGAWALAKPRSGPTSRIARRQDSPSKPPTGSSQTPSNTGKINPDQICPPNRIANSSKPTQPPQAHGKPPKSPSPKPGTYRPRSTKCGSAAATAKSEPCTADSTGNRPASPTTSGAGPAPGNGWRIRATHGHHSTNESAADAYSSTHPQVRTWQQRSNPPTTDPAST